MPMIRALLTELRYKEQVEMSPFVAYRKKEKIGFKLGVFFEKGRNTHDDKYLFYPNTISISSCVSGGFL